MLGTTHLFRPSWRYWFNKWLLTAGSIITLQVMGIYHNWGTPKGDNINQISIILGGIMLLFFVRSVGKQIRLTENGAMIRTTWATHFWPKYQIEAVDFDFEGENQTPHLRIGTNQKEFRFGIGDFNADDVEDAFEEWLGRYKIGAEALKQSARQKQEDAKLESQGESQFYVGGSPHLRFTLFVGSVLALGGGLSLFLWSYDFVWISIVALVLTSLWGLDWIIFHSRFYMNREHVIVRHWGKTKMIAWGDIEHMDCNQFYIVLSSFTQRLVIPGTLFWASDYEEEMSDVFIHQTTKHQIFASGDTYTIRPRDRDVQTDRVFPI